MEFRGRKYRKLYTHLCGLNTQEWRASFSSIETIIGDKLPPSARRYRVWWSNHSGEGIHHHARAWVAAGWETADVDIEVESLLFRRQHRPPVSPEAALDALDQLQTALAERGVDLARWAQNVRDAEIAAGR